MTVGRHSGVGLWVSSDVLPDGSYGVTISTGEDEAFTLTPERAFEYARACVECATEVEHCTALFQLCTSELGMPEELAKEMVARDLLAADADARDASTEPLQFRGAIARARYPRPDAGSCVPVVMVSLRDRELGTLKPEELRRHGLGVLTVAVVVRLDARLYRFLVDRVDASEEIARAMVGGLAKFLPGSES